MVITLSPILIVDDVNVSLQLYQYIFDLEVTQTLPDSENYDFTVLQNTNIEIMLQSRESASRELPAFFEGRSRYNNSVLYIQVQNIDKYFQRVIECEKRGIKIISNIKKTISHNKEFTFTDKDGIIVTVGELLQ